MPPVKKTRPSVAKAELQEYNMALDFKNTTFLQPTFSPKKQAKYVLQKNKYSLVLENKFDSPNTMTKVLGISIFGLP